MITKKEFPLGDTGVSFVLDRDWDDEGAEVVVFSLKGAGVYGIGSVWHPSAIITSLFKEDEQ